MSKGPWKKKAAVNGSFPPTMVEKPSIGLPDPQEAIAETARLAQEGNRKLCLAIDVMRDALEQIVCASAPGVFDRQTGQPVSSMDLGNMAMAGLDSYSRLTGQSWRLAKNKLTGPSRAGDRSMNFGEQ